MKHQLDDKKIAVISDIIQNNTGLYYPQKKFHDIVNCLVKLSNHYKISPAELIDHIINDNLSSKMLEGLINELTIGETYFFRDRKALTALQNYILKPLIASREKEKYLRIWSAGCATGEEPYTLSIMLNEIIEDIDKWNITILATDINKNFLLKLKRAVYKKWSMRGLLASEKNKYFIGKNNEYHLKEKYKNLVTSFYLNLYKDIYPSSINNTKYFDVILCRNVLMYFSEESILKITKKFYECLLDGGYLVVSPSEVSNSHYPNFKPMMKNAMTFYQKEMILNHQLLTDSNIETDHDHHLNNPRQKKKRSQNKNREDVKIIKHYANNGRLEEALSIARDTIAGNSSLISDQYLYASILYELGNYRDAFNIISNILYLDHNHVLACMMAGNIYRQQGDYHKMKKYYERVLNIIGNKIKIGQEDYYGGMSSRRLVYIIHQLLALHADK